MSPAADAQGTLSAHTREEIDRWVARFPPGRQRSAVISALRAAQEQNHGHLTPPLMDAVAAYLQLPPIQVYEVASFYHHFDIVKDGAAAPAKHRRTPPIINTPNG